jgi:hypothetical protein
MTLNNNMFGEKVIRIKGDDYLNKIAQHIYDLVNRKPEILTGDSIGNINRKIHLEMMFDSGLIPILTKAQCFAEFRQFYLSKACPTEEECARATRGLIEADLIRLPASIIKKSEQFKSRISSSMRR